MSSRVAPLFRAACLATAFGVTVVILYESTQARGRPGVLDLSTNEAYLGHFAVYALMAFCAITALAPRTLTAFVAVLLLATSLGIAMELYQLEVPTRSASAADAFADAAGAVFGVLAYMMLGMLLESPKRGQPTKL